MDIFLRLLEFTSYMAISVFFLGYFVNRSVKVLEKSTEKDQENKQETLIALKRIADSLEVK